MSLSDDIRALGKQTRLVVLLEKAPLSDEYRQVQLTQGQHMALTELLFRVLPKAPNDPDKVIISVDPSREYQLADLRTTYEPHELAKTIDEPEQTV